MKTVTAIYEKGVFRPLDRIELPESACVTLTVDDAQVPAPAKPDPVRAILSWRYDGEPDDAARVDPARK